MHDDMKGPHSIDMEAPLEPPMHCNNNDVIDTFSRQPDASIFNLSHALGE